MPRIFLAIKLTPEIKSAIAAHVQQLRQAWPKATISWVRPENLHLTVKFLGEVSAEKLQEVAAAADRAVTELPPFQIEIAGTGAFPPSGTPRVFWIGIRENKTLLRLHENVERELMAIGFPREDKSFHPHLTVGRVRAPALVREVADLHRKLEFEQLLLPVDQIAAIESQLSRTGPSYYERSKHFFRADRSG